MERISRRDFITIMYALIITALLGCKSTPKQSTPQPKNEPTPSAYYRKLHTYYPELQNLPRTYKETLLFTPQRDIHLFDYSIAMDPKQLEDLFNYFEITLSGINEVSFTYQRKDKQPISFSILNREPKDSYFVFIPADGPKPSWSVTTSNTASTQIFDDAYVTFVRSTAAAPSNSPLLKTPRDAMIKSSVVETFQQTRIIRASGKTDEEARTNANLMQEIATNSFAYAFIAANYKLPYSKYRDLAGQINIGPNQNEAYPLWIIPPELYELVPSTSNLFK